MKFFAAALALTLFLVGPAKAADEVILEHGQFACSDDKAVCLVRKDDFEAARKFMEQQQTALKAAAVALAEQQQVLDRQRRELGILRESKGCAKVTPLPKEAQPGGRGA